MTAATNVGGVSKNITAIETRVGGALKNVTEGWLRGGGALKQFFVVLAASLSTNSVIGRGNSAAAVNVTTGSVTATMQGAVGTVTYAWTRTAADAHAWTIDAPSSATTTFSTLADQGEQWDATFVCTMTDQAGQSITTSAVSADAANIYYGGGYVGGQPPAPGTVYP